MGVLRSFQGVQGTIGQPTAQVIDGSLKFDSASSQYLSSTSTFQNTKSYEMTFSFWLKRCAPTAVKATQYILKTNQEGTIFFDNDNSDQLAFNLRGSSGTNFFTYTSAKLRDYDAWYHVVVALNLGSGTQSQRFKCYINNVEQTMTNTSYPSNAYHTGGTWYIGSYNGSSHYPDYYLSNFYCISGQILDPSYFGFTDPQTNTWRPKKYTGTFTFDNSFYLPLDNEDDFGKDKSGEGNHFTQNNFSGTSIDPDVLKDSPSGAVFGGRGQTGITTTSSAPANYCTFNALYHGSTLSNGNLDYVSGAANIATVQVVGTIGVTSGKYYFEVTPTASSGSSTNTWFIGYVISDFKQTQTIYNQSGTVLYYGENGNKWVNNSGSSYGASYTNNDVIGVAADLTNNSITFYKNGTSQGAISFTFSGTYLPTVSNGDDTSSVSATANFGQKPFKYAPPQGFLPINSATARPNKVITRPDQYVGASIWTVPSGNADTHIITPFKPDLVMAKNRSNTSGGSIYNSVSGDTKFQRIFTSSGESDDAEATDTSRFNFNHNGFTFENGDDNANYSAGTNSVAWSWKAGGGKPGGGGFFKDDVEYASAAAAGLDGGTLTVTASSVGTKQGFSIIQYTGNSYGGATLVM